MPVYLLTMPASLEPRSPSRRSFVHYRGNGCWGYDVPYMYTNGDVESDVLLISDSIPLSYFLHSGQRPLIWSLPRV